MKLAVVTPTLCALATVACAVAAPTTPAARPADLDEVLNRLADESFVERMTATRELWKLGEQALPRLRELAEGADPEAALRARDLMRKIELGILPDSSPKIVDLVMRYDRGGVEERRLAVNALKRERAWRQILKLYALEKDEDSLAMLENATRGVALDAAREALSIEPPDIGAAFSFLEMARPEPAEYLAMAALYRSTGRLEEEIGKAAKAEGENIHLWRYALFAVAGRLEEAAEEAALAGEEKTAARLLMLAGNPVPWMKQAEPMPQTIPAAGLATYREFAIDSWEGRPVKADLFRELQRFVRGGDEEERPKELRLLFLAGQAEAAEKLLVDMDPRGAFYYFESTERLEEALEAFGLDPGKPDFTAWADQRFRVLIENPDMEEFEGSDLLLMGSFLERRGLFKELDEAFTPPMIELAKKDQEHFLRLCARLFSGNQDGIVTPTVRPVVQALAVFAGEDPVRWSMAVKMLFDGQEDPDQLWNWMAVLAPEMDQKLRLEWLCRIFGLLPDPEDERGKFFDRAWASVAKAEPVDRRLKLEILTNLSEQIGDTGNFLKGAEAIEELMVAANAGDTGTRFKGLHLAAAGRWKEAAAEWVSVVERIPTEPVYQIRAAVALRHAGEAAEADKLEKRAELLSLGHARTLYDCGTVFAIAGDFERALDWWKRAGACCTSETTTFSLISMRLTDAAVAGGDWKTAASLLEVQAFQSALVGGAAYLVPTNFRVALALRQRIDADLARAFSRLETDRAAALKEIERAVELPFAENPLADSFFAPMRAAGLVEIHDKAFDRLWRNLELRIEQYPDCDNTRNAAAWLASRANRQLDKAEEYLKPALANYPRQSAYLDTMAEVHFAAGDRATAVEFSTRSMEGEPVGLQEPIDLQLTYQHQRFLKGPFPPK